MGRSSRFTLTFTGRKLKSTPPPSISAPLSKAQKLLGTGEINIPAPSRNSSRQWEAHSNENVELTDTAAAYTAHSPSLDETPDDPARDGEATGGADNTRHQCEDESDVIPGRLKKATSHGNLTNKTPSLSHRESSSTIVSYYDKSKLPLSVSQQTSASAMARGLPAKASSILDIDGSRSSSAKLKKKPSKLEFSHLLPKTWSNRHLAAPVDPHDNFVPTRDTIPDSPSLLSVSLSSDFGLRHKPSGNSLRDNTSQQYPRCPQADSRARAAASTADLNDLYDRYEQQSFQDLHRAELDFAASEPRPGPSRTFAHQPPASNGLLLPATNSGKAPASPTSRTFSTSAPSELDAPAAAAKPPTRASPPADCAASVSSRHTRTSKASKRTDRSLMDLDLQHNSVLSLSSDSEDDYFENSFKQYGSTLHYSPRDTSQSPTSPSGAPSVPQSRPATDEMSAGNTPRPGSSPSANNSQVCSNAEKPAAIMVNGLPRINTRSSSLSTSSAVTDSPNCVSRLSFASTATNVSGMPSSRRRSSVGSDSFGIHEARAVTVTTAQNPGPTHSSPPRRSSQSLSYVSDLPVTPLSPSSVDYPLQSPPQANSQDGGSIRSGISLGTANFSSGLLTPPLSARASTASSRFMAVTRQEEMLLAALRLKRARMRGDSAGESDLQQDDESDDMPRHRLQPAKPHHRPAQPPPNQPPNVPLPQLPCHRPSQDRRSSSRQGSRRASSTMGRLAPLHEFPRPDSAASQRSPTDPSVVARHTRNRRSRTEAYQGEAERAHILTCLGHTSDLKSRGTEESDLDLGDLADLDVDSTEYSPTGSQSAAGPRAQRTSQPPRLPLPILTYGKTRPVKSPKQLSPPANSKAGYRRVMSSQTHSRARDIPEGRVEVNDEAGIPRPDSPISASASSLPFPNGLPPKKQVRLSAVGYFPSPEVGLWGDDG